jgi:plasmid stability protein
MAQLIVRNLENDIRDRIRALAELHGCSSTAERRICRTSSSMSVTWPTPV